MQDPKKVIDCYNKSAQKYAEKYINELKYKHLDSILLEAFAKQVTGNIIDLGCGPGQTTKFLYDAGLENILGTDISSEMIQTARLIHKKIKFEIADMLSLEYEAQTFDGAVAFYAIVHFTLVQLELAFGEINRILKKGGVFLFSFHIGSEVIHMDEFLNHNVDIDFYFFEKDSVLEVLRKTGFEVRDVIERYPYPIVEFPSKRAYIWCAKV